MNKKGEFKLIMEELAIEIDYLLAAIEDEIAEYGYFGFMDGYLRGKASAYRRCAKMIREELTMKTKSTPEELVALINCMLISIKDEIIRGEWSDFNEGYLTGELSAYKQCRKWIKEELSMNKLTKFRLTPEELATSINNLLISIRDEIAEGGKSDLAIAYLKGEASAYRLCIKWIREELTND